MRCSFPAILLAVPALAAPVPAAQALDVRMDPRLELLAIPFWLAGEPAFGKVNLEEYRTNLEGHFRAFKDHEAVRVARRLGPRTTWETLVQVAQGLQDDGSFEPVPGHPADPAWAPYLKAVADFSRDTKASAFLADNRSLYHHLVTTCQIDLGRRLSPAWFQRALGEALPLPAVVWVSPLLGGDKNATHQVLAGAGVILVGTDRTPHGRMPSYQHTYGALLGQVLPPPVTVWAERHAAALKPIATALQKPVLLMQQVQGTGSAEAVLHRSLLHALAYRAQADNGVSTAWMPWENDDRDGLYWTWDLAKAMQGIDGPILGPELLQRLDRLARQAPALAATWRSQRQHLLGFALQHGPKLVAMTPANGSTGVDPGLTLLTFTFDRPMDTARAVLPGKGAYPVFAGEASWDREGKVLTLPVRLAPHTAYGFSLNSVDLQFFKDRMGLVLAPVEVQFKTR